MTMTYRGWQGPPRGHQNHRGFNRSGREYQHQNEEHNFKHTQFYQNDGRNYRQFSQNDGQNYRQFSQNDGQNYRQAQFNRRNQEMDKPWISQDIRKEIWKRIQLGNVAKKSKSAADFKALADQKTRVEELVEEAKVNWLTQNPEYEDEWLKVLADENLGRSSWCDVCEKGFPSPALLKEHESEHATCGIDGCTYTAHQDVLEKHIMHQHLSGLYNKIPQGNSPEEIEKWKQERRKNFPTREKIVAKEAEQAEMRARGETMRLKRMKEQREKREQENAAENQEPDWECNCKARHLVKNGRSRGGRGGRGDRGRRNLRHQSHCKELENIRQRAKEKYEAKANQRYEKLKLKLEANEKNPQNLDKENRPKADGDSTQAATEETSLYSDSEDEEWNGGLFMFPGTAGLRSTYTEDSIHQNDQFHISDDEDMPASSNIPISDDEDDYIQKSSSVHHENPGVELSEKNPPVVNPSDKNPQGEVKADLDGEIGEDNEEEDDGPPEEVKICKNEVEFEEEGNFVVPEAGPVPESSKSSEENPSSHKRKRKRKHGGEDSVQPQKIKPTTVFDRPIRPPTLLERLLLDEIKRERNLILQCVRYVCNNGFLQD